MISKLMTQGLVASAAIALFLAFSAGPAAAGGSECGGKGQPTCPPVCDPKTQKCDICHNIGGPNALGADCDAGNCTLAIIQATGDADLIAAFGEALGVCSQLSGCDPADIYGGIVVPFGDSAFTAHFNHGDGFTLNTFDRIHATQPHVAANVGCFAIRHDPDPGN